MNLDVNAYNVGQEFVRLLDITLDLQKDAPVSSADTLVAEYLLRKFAHYTVNYILLDEEENSDGGDSCDEDYVDDDGLVVRESYEEEDLIPTERKAFILNYIREHPKHAFATHQKRFPALKQRNYVERWTNIVENGGTRLEKLKKVDSVAFEQFQNARLDCKTVHDIDLRRWALNSAKGIPHFDFRASGNWVANFKRRHGIKGRKIQRVMSKREVVEEATLLKAAEDYRCLMKTEMPSFNPRFVWSTDQVGIQYEFLGSRTLSFAGERKTFGFGFSPKDRATHSFTLQPIISLAGELVGDFYICLQETQGRMGPTVEQTVFAAPNLTVTCSASGKLTKSHIEYFLDKVVTPNVTEKFLLTFDNWRAQLDPNLYLSRYGKDDKPECKTIIVPEKCTSLVQPCDLGFNRQLKYLMRAIYHHAALHLDERLTDRDSVLKIASLVHFILSSPMFKGLIRHSWVLSGLLSKEENTDEVITVKNACFKFKKQECELPECEEEPFIKCSWCLSVICFNHFLFNYHVMECPKSPWLETDTYEKYKKVEVFDPELAELEAALKDTRALAEEVALALSSRETTSTPRVRKSKKKASKGVKSPEDKAANEPHGQPAPESPTASSSRDVTPKRRGRKSSRASKNK